MKMTNFNEYAELFVNVIPRPLKVSEYITIKLWEEQNVPLHELIKAYGLTMKNCNKFSFPYMTKIIENWIINQKSEV